MPFPSHQYSIQLSNTSVCYLNKTCVIGQGHGHTRLLLTDINSPSDCSVSTEISVVHPHHLGECVGLHCHTRCSTNVHRCWVTVCSEVRGIVAAVQGIQDVCCCTSLAEYIVLPCIVCSAAVPSSMELSCTVHSFGSLLLLLGVCT